MKILVVGLGSIGMRHARNFKTLGVEQLIGCDLLEERRQKFSSEINGDIVSTLEKGLYKKPDLVVVASPNRFHLEQAKTSARNGCHLFIEKPVSHTLEGLDDLITLVDEKSLFAHIGSKWKFHPAFKTMKKIINEGSLGKITGAQVIAGQWLPDWHPWEDYRNMYSAKKDQAGGIVLDSHEFDYLTWLLGPISKVSGYTAHTGALDIETEDIAVACMQFESGVL
ncbi:MAG TPA: Gfo/Idh/MocA family oxidoreductase, partial [candidate division Zixibacteria bacterium]|nr:Gfo/Idh/MocA family oxidoreductase [candidate division Zixibacteria bacterium]